MSVRLTTRAGTDGGRPAAVADYLGTVLPALPDERTLLTPTDTHELPFVD